MLCPVTATSGERLRAERERLGLSQDEFATQCGVHRRTQVNYELNRRKIPTEYLDAIDALGADSIYVASGSRVNFSPVNQGDTAAFVVHHVLRVLGLPADPGSLAALAAGLSDAVVSSEATGDADPLLAIARALKKQGATASRLTGLAPPATSAPAAGTGPLETLLDSVIRHGVEQRTRAEQEYALSELVTRCADEDVDLLLRLAGRLGSSRQRSVAPSSQPRAGAGKVAATTGMIASLPEASKVLVVNATEAPSPAKPKAARKRALKAATK